MRKIQTDRNILMLVILGIVTCGIYTYWFIYQLAQDVNEMCKEDGQTTSGLAVFILLSFVTCGLYAYYWYYTIQNRLQANAPKYGITINENGTSVILWCIIGMLVCGIGQYIGINIIIKSTNAMAVEYNKRYGL